jgi:hypothetical protein
MELLYDLTAGPARGIVSRLPRRFAPRPLFSRAFRRSIGNWEGAARDLDELEEIAAAETMNPMKLLLCDMASGRVGVVNPVRRPAAMRNISEWMEHVIARADRRAAHQVGGDRVSDALSQVEAVGDDGLQVSSLELSSRWHERCRSGCTAILAYKRE